MTEPLVAAWRETRALLEAEATHERHQDWLRATEALKRHIEVHGPIVTQDGEWHQQTRIELSDRGQVREVAFLQRSLFRWLASSSK